ncbi:MAG: hypothetical protein OXI67_10105 [Candidatus Poribacteria bacterium]|nr:hypothetical protein [Candidatus Poribacteria bacterium]
MRKLLPVVIILIIIGMFSVIIIRNNSRHSHNHLHPHDHTTEIVTTTETPVVSDQSENVVSDQSENDQIPVENVTVHKDITEKEADWLDAPQPEPSKQSKIDPFTQHIIEQERKEGEDWLFKDPETMDPEEVRGHIYKTLLKRHGDIPAVHDFIHYDRESARTREMPINEEIKGLEAVYELFPTETNRKNLAFHKWLGAKGVTLFGLGDLSDDDITELRSLGIQVTIGSSKNALRRVTISTK